MTIIIESHYGGTVIREGGNSSGVIVQKPSEVLKKVFDLLYAAKPNDEAYEEILPVVQKRVKEIVEYRERTKIEQERDSNRSYSNGRT